MATARPVTEGSVVITPRGVERLRSGHLWIYRSDVRSAQAEPGAIVRLTDERGNFFGRAFYSDKSQISIRLLTRKDVPIDRAFFAARIRRAAAYRELVVENSDACRMVYSEADLLPSVIVDRYGDYFVLQTLSQSSDRLKAFSSRSSSNCSPPRGSSSETTPRYECSKGWISGSAPPRRGPGRGPGKGKRRHFCLRSRQGPEDRVIPRSARKPPGRAALCLRRRARLLQLSGWIRPNGRGQMRARGGNRHGARRGRSRSAKSAAELDIERALPGRKHLRPPEGIRRGWPALSNGHSRSACLRQESRQHPGRSPRIQRDQPAGPEAPQAGRIPSSPALAPTTSLSRCFSRSGRGCQRRAQEYRRRGASDAGPGSPDSADHARDALPQVPDS